MAEIKALVISWLVALFPALGPDLPPTYAGYIEADYLYVSGTATRRLEQLEAQEGARIEKGQFLFEMENSREVAALHAAIAQRDVRAAELENLETGSREEEIAVIRASLEQARAEQSLARSNLARSQNLYDRGIVTTAKVDADRTALEGANARVAQLQAQLSVAELPAREAQIVAAKAALDAAEAQVDQARATLADLRVMAPASGLVDKVYYDPGEVVPAGSPVLSVLVPGELKVLFYIPEPERLSFAPGEVLALSCDGCKAGLTATITRLASDPQYTPPIIYSRDERTRLVYRAEARLDGNEAQLLPGQPVSMERMK